MIPVVCLLLAALLLYLPAVQNRVAKKAMAYISESVGWEIGFERIQLAFPLNFSVRHVCIKETEDDTLAFINRLTVDVRLKPLLKGHISVKKFKLESLELNTGSLLDGMVIQGKIKKISLDADSINLQTDRVEFKRILLSNGQINIFICDTTSVVAEKDSAINLLIGLKKVELKNINVSCRMPCDSIYADLQVKEAVLLDGYVDLYDMKYGASGLYAKIDELSYAVDEGEAAQGFDVSHVRLTDVVLASDSLYYDSEGRMYAMITGGRGIERSGIVINEVKGCFEIDSLGVEVPFFELMTDYSGLHMWAKILSPDTLLHPPAPVRLRSLTAFKGGVGLQLNLHKRDALLLAGITKDVNFPDTTLRVEVDIQVDRSNLILKQAEVALPGAFHIRLTGEVGSFDDERLRAGRVDYEVNMQKMDFLAGLLPSRFQMPDCMRLNGYLTIDKGVYTTETTGQESDGSILLSGNYDVYKDSYEVLLKIDGLEPVHFMPDDSIHLLSASVYAKGRGIDPYHPSTQSEIEGKINEIRYGSTSLTDISFSGNLKNNQIQAELESVYPLIKGRVSVDAAIKKDTVKGFLAIDADSLDFFGIGITGSPLSTSFQLFTEFETDLAMKHSLDMTLGNWNLNLESQTVRPKMLTLAYRSDSDTSQVTFYAGDMHIMLNGNSDLATLTDKLMLLFDEAGLQFNRDSVIDIQALRPYFPDISMQIHADRDNPVSHFLQEYNTFFEHFELNATLSPESGLAVDGKLLALVKDTLRFDTIRMNVRQDSSGLLYKAAVVKNRFRNQEPFKLHVNGFLQKNAADLLVTFLNSKGEQGLNLGVQAKKAPDGYYFHFYPEKPVIAYLPFTINNNNYFRFKHLNEMDADVRLRGDSNASIWIHSEHQDELTNELMIELDGLNLAEISGKFAAIPSLKGLLNVTCRILPMDNSLMLIADGNIDDLYYENGRIGGLLMNATYLPMEKGLHQIDFHAFHDMSEIISLSVNYQEEKDKVDGFIAVNRFPLQPFNAMIPDQMVRMDGLLNGKLDITGTYENPELSGELKLEKVSAYIVPASTTVFFDDQPVKMTKNKLHLDKYKIYTQKENPLIIEGTVDATNTSRPVVNLRMTGSNLQFLNARKTSESLIYGRMLVNVNTTLTGPLQALRMRGNMRVLGNTNLTYVMVDSPLEVEDNFSELVTFTYFADTLPRREGRPYNLMRGTRRNTSATAGTDFLVNINIDPVVRVRVELDNAQSNYVEWRGGGDLSLRYTTQESLSLNGRYTLSEGAIRYSIPVIPLTDFSIRNGSYVDWSGDPMNPYLNISAYTRARSSVNLGGNSRMVDFNTGIQLRDNLNDVSVQFLLEAPSDAIIQNQLTSMGAEERSKQAISLLVTGVYLASEGTGSDNMDVGAALSSLLQREVKNILGSLLGDVPVSFDVNTYDGTQGMGRRIDYIGRFYKNFYNERLNTTIGLRYSTKDPLYGNKIFPDDISLGYRLDTDGSRAIQVFRSREYENTFEGEIVKYGASFTIRRKVKQLKDLFVFRKQ